MQGVLGPINKSGGGGGPIVPDPNKEDVKKTWIKYVGLGPDPVTMAPDGVINAYVGKFGGGPTQTMQFIIPPPALDGKYFIIFQEGPADCLLDGNGALIDGLFVNTTIPAQTAVKFYWDATDNALRRG